MRVIVKAPPPRSEGARAGRHGAAAGGSRSRSRSQAVGCPPGGGLGRSVHNDDVAGVADVAEKSRTLSTDYLTTHLIQKSLFCHAYVLSHSAKKRIAQGIDPIASSPERSRFK